MATPYDIQHYNTSLLVSVPEGSTNTDASSLRLIGRNVQFYGDFQNENLVWLLENFARGTSPDNPLHGQLWFDTSANTIKVWDNNDVWRSLTPTASPTSSPPVGPQPGDLWFNTTTNQLFVYNGTTWVLIGPITPKNWGLTEVRAEIFTDTLAGTHKVLSQYTDGTRLAVLSADADFTAVSAADTLGANVGISGFATVRRGVNLNTTLTNAVFNGDAANALKLGGALATQYLRSDIDQTTTGLVTFANPLGLTVGAANELRILLQGASDYGVLKNNALGKGWKIKGTKSGGSLIDIAIFDPEAGTDGTVTIPGNLVVGGTSASTTAQRLATPRSIGISGFTTGSVMFDGSANVTIVGTTAYDPVNKAGDTMTGPLVVPGNGLTVGASAGPDEPQLIAISGRVGIKTRVPVTTLDVGGSLKAGHAVNVATSGNITLDAVFSTNHEINLSGITTIAFTNFTTNGQIVRVILTGTNNAVTWSTSPAPVYWPNGVTPNLAVGPQKVAIVTLYKSSNYITATYVTY